MPQTDNSYPYRLAIYDLGTATWLCRDDKAHGWDELSIKMIKLCDNTIVLPLRLVYEKCLATCTYPQIWKMANVLPIHKKESRQIKKKLAPDLTAPYLWKNI